MQKYVSLVFALLLTTLVGTTHAQVGATLTVGGDTGIGAHLSFYRGVDLIEELNDTRFGAEFSFYTPEDADNSFLGLDATWYRFEIASMAQASLYRQNALRFYASAGINYAYWYFDGPDEFGALVDGSFGDLGVLPSRI